MSPRSSLQERRAAILAPAHRRPARNPGTSACLPRAAGQSQGSPAPPVGAASPAHGRWAPRRPPAPTPHLPMTTSGVGRTGAPAAGSWEPGMPATGARSRHAGAGRLRHPWPVEGPLLSRRPSPRPPRGAARPSGAGPASCFGTTSPTWASPRARDVRLTVRHPGWRRSGSPAAGADRPVGGGHSGGPAELGELRRHEPASGGRARGQVGHAAVVPIGRWAGEARRAPGGNASHYRGTLVLTIVVLVRGRCPVATTSARLPEHVLCSPGCRRPARSRTSPCAGVGIPIGPDCASRFGGLRVRQGLPLRARGLVLPCGDTPEQLVGGEQDEREATHYRRRGRR